MHLLTLVDKQALLLLLSLASPRSRSGDDNGRTLRRFILILTFIDVRITPPASKTNMPRARRRLVAAEHYAMLKQIKFREQADEQVPSAGG